MENHKTLLLVEDEPIVAENEASLLKTHGFNVLNVNNGEKAIETVRQRDIDLILMDLDLGKNSMDGSEAAQTILEIGEYPIIFLTCHSEKVYLDKIKNLTYYGYVPKDCGKFLLLAAIENAFRLFEIKCSPFHSYSDLKVNKSHVREKHDKYRTLAENAGAGIIVIQNHRIHYANETAAAVYGFERGAFHNLAIEELILHAHPEDKERITKAYRKGCSAIENYKGEQENKAAFGSIEYRHIHAGGREVWIELITTAIVCNDAPALLIVMNDITDRHQAQEIIAGREDNLKTILENLPLAVFAHNMEGKLILVNKAAAEYTGYSKEELLRMNVSDLDPESISRNDRDLIWHCLLDREVQRIEAKHIRKDGSVYPVEIFINAVRYDGQPILLAIAEDITERKKVIEQKDYLMKELNHRVKNNLLMISSLISLKNSALDGIIDLSDLQHQIDAIRIVHEKLYQTEEINNIDFKDYADELLSTIFCSFGKRPIKLENNISDAVFPTKLAISLGLMVNEIATNAVKHAFSEEIDNPRFSIAIKRDNAFMILTLSNNGPPFPEEIGFNNPETLGLRLVEVLVQQIDGEITVTREPHPVFTLRFPYSPEEC